MTAALEGGEWSAARPRKRPGTDCTGGCVGPSGKSRTHLDSIPDRPIRSQLLYRLSYPAHREIINLTKYILTNRNIPNNDTEIALF